MRGSEMKKVLIMEDELNIRSFVVINLKRAGYDVIEAGTGQEALDRIQEHPDIGGAILDIMLPQLSGIEVLRRLRKSANAAAANVPVILLTARDAVTDKVTGLDMGANDYMTKPFAIEELLARIRAALRQSQNGSHGERAEKQDGILRAAGIELNVSAHTVTYGGKTVDFTRMF